MCYNHNHFDGDCLECIKESHFEHQQRKLAFMMPDNAEGKPGDFLDGTLVALKPMVVFSSPNGKEIRTVKANQTVGKILSYVVRDGIVWWELYDKGFVKHGAGLFDPKMLEVSVAAEKAAEAEIVKKAAAERMKNNQSALYQTGKELENLIPDFDTIKWILITILVLVVITMLYKILK